MFAVCGDISLAAVFLACVVVLFTILLYRHFSILRRHGIPGPTPRPLVGNLLQMQSLGTTKADQLYQEKYGKIYGYYQGYRPIVAVADPDILRSVLIKDFSHFVDRTNIGAIPPLLRNGVFFMQGRTWKRTRNILTPTFSAGKLKHLVGIMNNSAGMLASNMDALVGQTVHVKKVFGQFTIDTIAAMAFGLDIDSQKQPDEPFVYHIGKFFDFSSSVRLYVVINSIIPIIGPLMYKLGFSSWKAEDVDFFDRAGKALIQDRKTHKTDRYDFMKLLIEAEFEESKSEYIHADGATVETLEAKDDKHIVRLNEDEINGSAFTFFLAGYETLASTLRYSAYVLAVHPEEDKKIWDEMTEKLGKDAPTYENIAKLTYLEQFVNEVLRFYPPVPRLIRVANENHRINEEMTIPKGCNIHVPVRSIHHNPEYYADPETFNPDRFAPENKNSMHACTFLPFGVGPRHCIGMRLAYVEAKVALVHVLRKVRFVRCEETVVPLEFKETAVLQPTKPVMLQIEAR